MQCVKLRGAGRVADSERSDVLMQCSFRFSKASGHDEKIHGAASNTAVSPGTPRPFTSFAAIVPARIFHTYS
jgi:hypothetical protein